MSVTFYFIYIKTAVFSKLSNVKCIFREGMSRFEVELEFVECLANPAYLAFMSQQPGLLGDARFRAYLVHLLATWTRPSHAALVAYPDGVAHLRRLVEEPGFGDALRDPVFVQTLHREQYERWATSSS